MQSTKINVTNEPRKPNEDELGQLAFFLMLAEKYGSHLERPLERLKYVREQLDKAYIAVFERHPKFPEAEYECFMLVVWPTGVNNFEVYDFADGGDIGRIVRNDQIVRFTAR